MSKILVDKSGPEYYFGSSDLPGFLAVAEMTVKTFKNKFFDMMCGRHLKAIGKVSNGYAVTGWTQPA